MIPIEITQTPISSAVYEQSVNTAMNFGYFMLVCGLLAGFAIGYAIHKIIHGRVS